MCSDPAPHERCDPNPAVSSIDKNSYLLYIRSGSGARPNLHRNSRPAIVSRPGHPCVCGEQSEARRHKGNMLGSSPRVRGTDLGSLIVRVDKRVIPACAGNR